MLTLERGRALLEKRQVLWLLVVRDLKVRYAQSALGYIWTVLDPLLMSAVYWVVFGVIFHRGGGKAPEPYLVFLVSGVLVWQWFSSSVTDTTRALIQESRLVRSTNLPREIWVVKIVVAKGVEFLLSVPVIAIFMIFQHATLRLDALWSWPLAIFLQFVLLTGIGLALATTAALVTDLQRVVRIILRMLMYLSPIVYAVSQLPDKFHFREIMALNPMTGILDLYRRGLSITVHDAHDQVVAAAAPWHTVLASVLISFAVLLGGARLFRRLESPVLKEI